MRLLFISLFLLLFSITFAQADKVKIPKGVTYNYAADSIVEQAKALIRQDLENEDSYVIANKLLIVGPQLWKRFGKIKSLKEIEGGNTTFLVDNLQLKGKTAQDVEDSKKIWAELRKEVAGQPYTIRKLNEKELRYYWSVISFDIDEPLLVIETKKHRYILNLLKSSQKLMWLDEAP